MEATQMSINRWINSEDVVYKYITGYYSAIKQKQNFAIWSNINGLAGHYAKWNKSYKGIYCMISFLCGIKNYKKLGVPIVTQQ